MFLSDKDFFILAFLLIFVNNFCCIFRKNLTFCFLKDIIVHPKFRNKGVGTIVVNTLLERIRLICCDHAYVGLMSTVGAEGFYEKFGFITRPNNHFGSGMVMYVEK